MGAFGIFLSILTFITVVYYCVVIGMDLIGDKKQAKDSEEIIPVAGCRDTSIDVPDECPTIISEDTTPTAIDNQEDSNHDEKLSESNTPNAEEIAKEKNGEIIARVNESMVPCGTKMQEEYPLSEINDEILENLLRQSQMF